MAVVDDPAPPLGGATFRLGFDAPGRMSPIAAVRGASRLARREVRRRPGRTLLVVALVAVPVLAMTLGVVLARTTAQAGQDEVRRRLGGVADLWSPSGELAGYQDGPGLAFPEPVPSPGLVVEDLLPTGSRTVGYTELDTTVVQAGAGAPSAFAHLSDLPLGHPVVGDQVDVRAGRAPLGPDEVLLSSALADDFDVAVGDTLELAQPEGAWQVAGIGRRPADWRARELVFGSFDWSRVEAGHAVEAVLADLPEGTVAEDLVPLAERTPVIVADPDLVPPSLRGWGADRDIEAAEVETAALVWGWVAGALALVVVGIIVAAAFATSARRQLVTIGQLAAQGAPRSLVRLTLALQGSWSGLLGSVAGVGGALALLTGGRSVVEQIAGKSLGGYVVRPSDVAIVVITGTVAGTVAALVPARSAARVPVLAALSGRRPLGQVPRRLVPAGLTLFGGGMGLLTGAVALGEAHTENAHLMAAVAVLGGLGILFGACCASPLAIDVAGRLGGRLRGVWRLAARSLGRQRTRSAGVTTAIAVTGAVALMAIVAVATASEGRWASPDDEDRYALPSLPPDVVAMTWPGMGVPTMEDRPVPADLVDDLEEIVPGGTLIPRRVAYSFPPVPGEPDPLPGEGIPPPGWNGSGPTALVAEPALLDAMGLSARDRATLEERGILALWPPPGPFPDEARPWPDGDVMLYGVDDPVALRQDGLDARMGETDALVTAAAAEGVGLFVFVEGGWWDAPTPLSDTQRGRLGNLRVHQEGQSVFRSASEAAGAEPVDGPGFEELGPYVDWQGDDGQVSPFAIQVAVVAVALLFTLLVMAIGLSLSATESRDERDVLVAVGAPPRTLRRMAGIKALLLTTTAMVLAVPTGLAPSLLVITRVADRSLVLPVPALALLLLGVPVVAGLAAWGASTVAQRVRPVHASTFAQD